MYSDDSDIQKMQSESNSYLVSKDRNQSNYSNLYSIENKKKINNRVE